MARQALKFTRGILTPIAFTDGKVYEVVGSEGMGLLVRNDNGHLRFVMPGESHGHCILAFPMRSGDKLMTGSFDIVEV